MYRLRAELGPLAPEPYAIHIPRGGNRLELSVNGERLARLGELDRAGSDYSKLPRYVTVPRSLLRTGGNEILVRVAAEAAGRGGISELWIGPDSELRPRWERTMRWLARGSLAIASTCAALGALALAIAWRLRDRLYAVFGIASLLWALRTAHVLVVEPPIAFAWWSALMGVAYGWYVGLICLFSIDALRMRVELGRRVLGAYMLVTPAASIYAHIGGAPQAWAAWLTITLLLSVAMCGAVILTAVRRPNTESVLLSVAALAACAIGARDHYLFRSAAEAYGTVSLVRYAAFGFMLAMAWILADRFGRAMRAEAEAKQILIRRLAEQAQQLSANHERLRGYERERAAAAERQRIMQDMHDGLGSQLLSSLAMVERGALDRHGMAQVLREAIDDLRLAIDTLAPGRESLLEALANMRYRLEPRFRAAGIELRFRLHALHERLDVKAEAALQILRVLQEALTNVLKHAGAKRVDVDLSLRDDPARLVLEVADDGAGFDPAAARLGRGLSGMRRRAEDIGATLELTSGKGGTRIALVGPLSAAICPPANAG